MDGQRRCLYVWEWQRLRVKLHFNTQQHTLNSLKLLREYAAKNSRQNPEVNRVYQVLNLLCATRMGTSGQMVIAKKVDPARLADLRNIDEMLMVAREEYSSRYDILQRQGHVANLRQAQTERMDDLLAAAKEDALTFRYVMKSLEQRFYSGAGAKVDPDNQEAVDERARKRPELAEYLTFMRMAAQEVEINREAGGEKDADAG